MEHLRRYILTDWVGRVASFQLSVGLVYLTSKEIEKFSICQNILPPNSLFTWRWSDRLFFLDDQDQINFAFTFALFFAASITHSKGCSCWGAWLWLIRLQRIVKCCLCQQAWLADELCVKPLRFGSNSWAETWTWTAPLCFLCHAKAFPPRAGSIVHWCGHWLSITTEVPHLPHRANPIVCAFILVRNEENCRQEILYMETEIHINSRTK